MSAIVNPRDILMQAAPSRLYPVILPPNIIIPELLPDLEVPPTPTGFAVSAAISNIIIQHDAPLFSVGNSYAKIPVGHGYARTNVYGALWYGGARPVFADAVRIASFTGVIAAHATNPAQVWHLWITWESKDGVESLPAGGENGLIATTGQDVERMVAAMTGPGNPFTILEEPTEIDGVLYPAGTYTTLAMIFEAQISRAKIALLAVDDARIASLAVSKLTAGAIAVSEYIRSFNFVAGVQGFEIHGSGWAEFNNVLIRGELNTGDFTGYVWPAAGGTGSHLSASGLMIGNANDGKYFHVTAGGDVYAPGFSIVAGHLAITSGVFSGSLSAALTGSSHAFETPGTHSVVVPAGATTMRATLIGAGAGGGGGQRQNSNSNGAGGGAGGVTIYQASVTPGSTIGVVVGAGGIGGAMGWGNFGSSVPGLAGSAGGSTYTSIAGSPAAGGGGGGPGAGWDASPFAPGGIGGSGHIPGAPGRPNSAKPDGGASFYGKPGAGATLGNHGGNATGFAAGGGGGGGHISGVDVELHGGNGAPGKAVIEFFNSNTVVIRSEWNDQRTELDIAQGQLQAQLAAINDRIDEVIANAYHPPLFPPGGGNSGGSA